LVVEKKRSAPRLEGKRKKKKKKVWLHGQLSLRRGLNLEKSTHYLSIYLGNFAMTIWNSTCNPCFSTFDQFFFVFHGLKTGFFCYQRIKKPKCRHMKRRGDRGGPLIEIGRTKWTNKWRLDIKILIRGRIRNKIRNGNWFPKFSINRKEQKILPICLWLLTLLTIIKDP
jgi:hypothetical protein